MKIKFEKLGLTCESLGDIKNFRIMSEKFLNKDGEETILQISLFPGTKPKKRKELIYSKVFIYKDNGDCVGDVEFSGNILRAELEYTLENALKVVNMISKEMYTEIEFI